MSCRMNDWANPRPIGHCSISLARSGWLTPALADTLHRMVGFRNILVHGYDDVDLRVVEDVVANRLDDLLAFVAAVRARLGA